MHNSETNIIVIYWLKIFGSIIFMLLCLSGYRYGQQIAAAGFMTFAIKFFDDSLAFDGGFKKNIGLGQISIYGIVCGLTSWISFFYLMRSDGFVAASTYFAVFVLVINLEYLSHKKIIVITKNKDIKENFILSSLRFFVLMPTSMLIMMVFGPHVLILVSVVTATHYLFRQNNAA